MYDYLGGKSMTDAEQREAARQFVNRWMGKGKEDEDGRSYWIDLLTNVLGMDNVTERLNFEKKVVIDGNTKRIDVYIPETRVIIEQKSLGKALDQKIRNSGDVDLTPFEQADRYNGKLTFDERARWIVTSNFAEIYVSVLDKSDIKYSTFNRYITHMHTFLQFLKMKNIEVLKFYPERFLKKGFSEHNERSVPEKTIAHLIKELPAFPEHLQLMYLILFCTGIRKSEVCTIKSGAFYSQGNENWMRIYQSKMRREKVIPVPSLLVGLVNDYEKKYGIKNGEYLFKNKKGGAFNGQTFSNQMIRECKVRGIACGDYIFRAHDYRHNLATSMYGNGVSIQGVRDYLGHSSENMTKQYIDFMPERIVSAEDKYFSKNQSFKLKGAEDDER